ncbi:hypothetical protein ABB25_13785 [Stenotrophomonas koreensis]|uniref:Uncharacterized protein n=1 Tax=Stenotrophomonas koreensis TaxID=266128 RepID=A0A0R0BA78_9GAMM|nr:hypothetical protein ABB25_13785 [Stenotrophomonas koreensis]
MEALVRLLVFLFAAFASLSAHATDIASCSEPSGKGYYPETGVIKKADSGWEDEKISSGITKLTKNSGGEYDILFVDIRREIISARADGGTVIPLSRGAKSFSVLVVYPGKTAEVYTFLENTSGGLEYLHTLSRAGDEVFITKASVMQGVCSYIHFDQL